MSAKNDPNDGNFSVRKLFGICMLCDLGLLYPLESFKNICGGVSFLLKFQANSLAKHPKYDTMP